MLSAVLDHALEFRAVIGLGGISTVYVVPKDHDPILLSIFCAFADLPLYALFSLIVGGIRA